MNSLKRKIKSTLEHFFGNYVWLDHPSDLDDVRALVAKLRPIVVDRPLIRIGKEGDGGYIAPDDLEGISVTVSPGVSDTVDFDIWMAERGTEVYMVDASVDGPPIPHPKFHFQKKFLDVYDDASNVRLDTLCAGIAPEHDGDRILQIDIEGAEYRVLLDASDDVLRSFRIVLVEFHDLDRAFSSFSFKMIKATFDKLLRHYYLVHIHPNNISAPRIRKELEIPPVMEFTFYRKDRAAVLPDQKAAIPHPLDSDNIDTMPSVKLPEFWHFG